MTPNLRLLAVCQLVAVALAFACAGSAKGQDLAAPPLAAGNLTAGNPAAGQSAGDEGGEKDGIETDRDSFTFATSLADVRTTILESSYSFIDNRAGPETHSFPETLVRRGLTKWCELRVGWNYEAGGPGTVSGNEVGGEDLRAETDGRLLYGAKFFTSQQNGWMPQSSLIVQGYTPTAGPSKKSTMDIGEAFGWTFKNGWTWNSALRFGTANEKGDSFVQYAPSTVLKIPVGEKWNVHAEYFGIVSYGKQSPLNEHFISLGGHVLLTPKLELGLRFGFGLNQETPGFFNNVGLGWQF